MALDLGTLRAFLDLDTSKYDENIDKSQNKTQGFTGAVPGLMGVAAAAIVAGALAAGAGLLALGGEFDDLEDKIAVGTGKSGEELGKLQTAAENAATAAGVSFDKAGQPIIDFSQRLGLTGDELEDVTTKILTAGRVLDEDIDTKAATGAFAAFKVEGKEVSGALDYLFTTSQQSGIGMNDLMGKLQSAAPIAQQLGFSMEETAGLIGTMDKAGLDSGTMIGAMQKGLVNLAKAGEDPQEAFRRVTGEIQGMVDKGDQIGALDLAGKVFGTRGAAQFVGALESGKINLDELAGAAGASDDSIMKMGSQTEDFAEKWQRLVNGAMLALKPIATEVFNGVGQALDAIAPIAEGAFAWVGDNIPLLTNLGVVLLSFAASWAIVTAALAAYNAVQTIMKAVTAAGTIAQWAMNVAMSANPVGLIIIAIAALIAIIVLLVMNWDTVVAFVSEIWQGFVNWLAESMSAFGAWWDGVWSGIISFFSDLWNGLVSWFTDLWNNLVLGIALIILGYVAFWRGVWQGIVDFFTDLWTGVVSFFTSLWEGIVAGVKAIILGYVVFWMTTWRNIVDFFTDLWNGVQSFFRGLWNGIINFVVGLIRGFVSTWNGIWQGIADFFSDLWSGVEKGVKKIWGDVLSFFKGIPDKILGFFSGVGSWLFNVGKDLIDGLLSGISSMAGKIGSFFLSILPGWMVEPFKAALGIHSPSRLFGQFGRNTVEGYLNEIERMKPDVNASLADLVDVPQLSMAAAVTSNAADNASAAPAGSTKVIQYYAAENQSLSAEEALFDALNSPRVGDDD